MFDPSTREKNKAKAEDKNKPKSAERKYAIPVGTGSIIEFDKFLFEHRDKACNKCKNGFKSAAQKTIGTQTFTIPIICVCVPYIQSEDKEGNKVVSYKGFRELWPDGERPEAYIQKELKIKALSDTAKAKLNHVRNSNTAHEGVQKGKYTIGKKLVVTKNAAELEKSMEVSKPASSVKPIQKDEFDKFFEGNKRKAAFRNKEGNIVVVDNNTALKMMKAGVLFDPNPVPTPEPQSNNTPSDNVPNGNAPKDGASSTNTPSVNTPAKEGEGVAKRGRGRPKGAKNKAKISKP